MSGQLLLMLLKSDNFWALHHIIIGAILIAFQILQLHSTSSRKKEEPFLNGIRSVLMLSRSQPSTNSSLSKI